MGLHLSAQERVGVLPPLFRLTSSFDMHWRRDVIELRPSGAVHGLPQDVEGAGHSLINNECACDLPAPQGADANARVGTAWCLSDLAPVLTLNFPESCMPCAVLVACAHICAPCSHGSFWVP